MKKKKRTKPSHGEIMRKKHVHMNEDLKLYDRKRSKRQARKEREQE